METINTYTQTSPNTIFITNDMPEATMADPTPTKPESTYSGPRLIFQFPPRSFKDDEIKLEVKAIMEGALKEQLQTQQPS